MALTQKITKHFYLIQLNFAIVHYKSKYFSYINIKQYGYFIYFFKVNLWLITIIIKEFQSFNNNVIFDICSEVLK